MSLGGFSCRNAVKGLLSCNRKSRGRIMTGCDPNNTRWSYHNGGSWPVLLWLLTAASLRTGRPQIARRAIDLVESRLSRDSWPEYYDGKIGRYIGKQVSDMVHSSRLLGSKNVVGRSSPFGYALEEDNR